MKKLFIMALASTMIVAPLAHADTHKKKHVPDNHHAQKYPKGWGPHHGPDRKGYYHGYQGHRDHRPGYRRGNDGLWYPAAAFAIGALIGGALNN